MTDEPYNAAERSHVKAAAKASRFADRERGVVVKGVMDTTSGRAWMHYYLQRCHIFASSFSEHAIQMAFTEGERNIGLQLLQEVMAHAPDSYLLMMREANERDASTASNRDRDSDSTGVADLIE